MASLDYFRGAVSSTAPSIVPVLTVVPVGPSPSSGFFLEFAGDRLSSARGNVRHFRSLDSLFLYVRQYISGHCRREVELRITCIDIPQLLL